MSNNFTIEIITPTTQMDLGSANYLRLPGIHGLFGVMKNHTASLVSLGIGEIKIEKSDSTEYWATSGGVLDFNNNKAQLLLETVEQSSDIDIERAEHSQDRAKKRLNDVKKDRVRSEMALAKAINRLKVGKRS
ncbi:MAG: ATP synthase F1 subunit epsilon [Candidatus Marinimicrobia bacterium]|nr:ATP synthase F1 subunit epsilon [Candidatus Neomarinimicrobiota bacterium]